MDILPRRYRIVTHDPLAPRMKRRSVTASRNRESVDFDRRSPRRVAAKRMGYLDSSALLYKVIEESGPRIELRRYDTLLSSRRVRTVSRFKGTTRSSDGALERLG